jgi:hypothetical protein
MNSSASSAPPKVWDGGPSASFCGKPPSSINELAKITGRARKKVQEDVRILEQHDLMQNPSAPKGVLQGHAAAIGDILNQACRCELSLCGCLADLPNGSRLWSGGARPAPFTRTLRNPAVPNLKILVFSGTYEPEPT